MNYLFVVGKKASLPTNVITRNPVTDRIFKPEEARALDEKLQPHLFLLFDRSSHL